MEHGLEVEFRACGEGALTSFVPYLMHMEALRLIRINWRHTVGYAYNHGRTGQPDNLALPGGPVGSTARRATTSNVEVGQMRSIVRPLIPKFKAEVLFDLLNPQTTHRPSSFVILFIRDLSSTFD